MPTNYKRSDYAKIRVNFTKISKKLTSFDRADPADNVPDIGIGVLYAFHFGSELF